MIPKFKVGDIVQNKKLNFPLKIVEVISNRKVDKQYHGFTLESEGKYNCLWEDENGNIQIESFEESELSLA